MAEFVGAGTKALILVANKLGSERTNHWAQNGEAMECAFLGVLMSFRIPIPADGVEFELTLDGDVIDPIAMVQGNGYGSPEKWKFNGPKVKGAQTGTFKLLRAGGANLAAVKEKLSKEGPLAEGEWREAFKAKFSHDGNGPIGFGGSEWVDPVGSLLFPYMRDGVYSFFSWVGDDFSAHWRWLVRVK